MRRRLSFKDLVSQNKTQILKDTTALEKIEDKIERKHARNKQ